MKSGTASALEVNRALVQILSRKFAQDAELGNVSAMAVNGIKQALQELRQAEQDYVEMSVRNRDMIPRADVMAMVGTMMARMFRVHGNFENSVATEFSLWLADPKVQAMETADRARVIREFVAKAAADVRRMEADGVEKLIDAK